MVAEPVVHPQVQQSCVVFRVGEVRDADGARDQLFKKQLCQTRAAFWKRIHIIANKLLYRTFELFRSASTFFVWGANDLTVVWFGVYSFEIHPRVLGQNT